MGDSARALDCARRPAGELRQQPQRFDHRRLPYDAAPDRAEALFTGHDAAVTRRGCEMHEAHRLARRCAAGTGDAGDGDSDVGGCLRQRAFSHGRGNDIAHGAQFSNGIARHAEQSRFGFIGIRNEAAIHL